jgi:hypothetical protein
LSLYRIGKRVCNAISKLKMRDIFCASAARRFRLRRISLYANKCPCPEPPKDYI